MAKNKNDDLQFIDYDKLLTELKEKWKNKAINIYEWKNLPEGIDSRKLEEFLYLKGVFAVYDDQELGNIYIGASPVGQMNYQNDYMNFTLQGYGYVKTVRRDNLGIVYTTRNYRPKCSYIDLLCQKIAFLETTIDTNAIWQGNPLVVECDESTRKSYEEMYKKVINRQPIMFVKSNMAKNIIDNKGSTGFMPKIEFTAPALKQLIREYENEIRTELGIDTLQLMKKERMLVDEVNANNNELNITLQDGLKIRQECLDEIKKKFDIFANTTVEIRNESAIRSLYDGELGRTERREQKLW